MIPHVGMTIELKSGLWVDSALMGQIFTIEDQGLEIKFGFPKLSNESILGFQFLERPFEVFPLDTEWPTQEDFGGNYWGYMSNHVRDGETITSATFYIRRLLVSSPIPDGISPTEHGRKVERVWNEFWSILRAYLEIFSNQDLDNGSNLDRGNTQSNFLVTDTHDKKIRNHLVADLGTHPLIQARSLSEAEFLCSLRNSVNRIVPEIHLQLLREARLRYNSQEYTLSFLHSATALELKLVAKLRLIGFRQYLRSGETVDISKCTLGTLIEIWNREVEPGFQAKIGNLVEIRNNVVHEGAVVGESHSLKLYNLSNSF